METKFKGIKASSGIAYAKALVFLKEEIVINKSLITDDMIDNEKTLYNNAVKKSYSQMKELIETARVSLGEDKAAIFEAHLEILEDPMLQDSVMDKIEKEKKNSELALFEATEEISSMFLQIEDEYLKERGADVIDICGRIMQNLKGIEIMSLSNLSEEVIVVAKDLTPSDTASMDLSKVKGFVTDIGGKTSHTSIIARSLELPAIVGMGNFLEYVKNGDFIIIDGMEGIAYLNPSKETFEKFKFKKAQYDEHIKMLAKLKDLPAITTDEKKVELAANIGNPKEVESANNNGAEGIGLFRTEFLYMDNDHFPTEEEQFEAYKAVAVGMNNKPVIIRTLDIGGDKDLTYYKFDPEMNPFLGYRALRICLDKIDIFKTQLRAILRASAFGKIRIMFPMVISVTELRKAKEITKECMSELKNENISFDENIEIGTMIETPAAAVIAEKLAKECDFFSIGTNDLTQYLLAVDRGNEKISSLYNSFNPAVLLSIKNIIDASHKEGKWTGMCGEFASDEKAVLVLLGLGLDEFSMSASAISSVKNLIRKISYKEMQEVATKALEMDTPEEIETYLDEVLQNKN